MLIVMAGLPGSGKSTIAVRLEQELGAVIFDKDRVRTVLFPPRVLDYSAEQDDICMTAIYQAAGAVIKVNPRQPVLIDGRTFLRPGQIASLMQFAASTGASPRIIECVCDDAAARERLEADQARAGHPAKNRTFALYQVLRAAAAPIPVARLTLDTGSLSLEECVRRSIDYLTRG